MIVQDPDGRKMRIYTEEDHGGTEEQSVDEYWLMEL